MAVADRIGRRAVLMGVSTGGTLALWAASRPEWSERIDAVAILSPNLGPKDPRADLLLWPWGRQLARLVIGPRRSWVPANDRQALYWTTEYPSKALLPMMALVDMVRDIDAASLTAPVLTLYAAGDQVVDVERYEPWFAGPPPARWTGAEISGSGDPDQHILAGDILSPVTTDEVRERIVTFVRETVPEARETSDS